MEECEQRERERERVVCSGLPEMPLYPGRSSNDFPRQGDEIDREVGFLCSQQMVALRIPICMGLLFGVFPDLILPTHGERETRETKEKSERLEKTMQKKLQLLAEVKFLRGKCQQFSAAPKTIHSKLEKQAQPQHLAFRKELPLKRRSQKGKHIPAQTSAAVFDLNHVSAPTGEEMEWFDQNAGMFKRFSREGGDGLANDAMLSICRDSGIGSSRSSKRKVSWHDPLALRV